MEIYGNFKYNLFLFVFITLFSRIISNGYEGYKCGVNKMKIIPKPIKASPDIHYNNTEYRRRLSKYDKEGFKQFNIYLDLYNFEEEIIQYNLSQYRDMFKSGMEKAVNTLTSLLKIKDITKNYRFTDEQILNIGINNWNKTVIGNYSYKNGNTFLTLDIDLVIFVRFGNKSEMGENTLASAGAYYIDNDDGHPLVGLATINREVNYTKIKSKEYFESIIIHEFTHILGFSNYYFSKYFNNILSKEDKYGILRNYINSTKVVNTARKYFNCSQIEGVELEESGGEGTVGSHWEARILLGDYMNGVIYPEEQVISEFTLALLEDSGYYKANYYTGGLMRFGKHKGCNFVFNKCINNGEVDSKFKNEFFFELYSAYKYDTSCSSGRQSRTYHYLLQYKENIPEKYQYYSKENIGGYSSADYCPVSLGEISEESQKRYYLGHCSDKKGSDVYGRNIIYESDGKRYYYESGYLSYLTGEVLSNNSFCSLSSLKKTDAKFYSDIFRAICYPMFCSEKSLTILVLDNYIVCPRSGGKITALGFDGHLICPDYNLICSGTVLCNDMFDCVDKKSEMKEDIYDYEIKTNQDLEDIKIDDIIENVYELSENGKCPIYCSQCNDLGQCLKCRNDYGIIEEKGDINKRFCLSNKELENGYYKKEDIYYKCIENCNKCKNDSSCEECNSGYIQYSNACYLEIKNCEIYNKDGTCNSCIENYQVINNTCQYVDLNCEKYNEDSDNRICVECKDNYRLVKNVCKVVISNCEKYDDDGLCDKCNEEHIIIDNNKTICQNKNIINDEYYTNDNGTNYYKCDGEGENKIKNCKRCTYNDTKTIKLTCKECQENFALLDEIENKCYSKEIANNKSFYLEDDNHLKSCSKKIDNCLYCEKDNEKKIMCEKCKNDYFFVNDNYLECIQKENINPIDEYFLDEKKGCYYSCGNFSFSKIENCKKCQNSENCTLCKQNFTFINNNKSFCYEIKGLGNEYYLDPNDNSNYKKCSDSLENCLTCSTKDICLSCISPYGLFSDKSKCVNTTSNYYYKNSTDDLYYFCNNNLKGCTTCENEKVCLRCEENDYGLIEDNVCIKKSILKNKYFKDESDGKYKLCNKGINNCEECSSSNECLKCDINYTKLNNDKTSCHRIDTLTNEYIPDPKDKTNYMKCSYYMKNCYLCESSSKCILCDEDFIFINDDFKNCINKSQISIDSYYTDDNKTFYSCDVQKYKSNIKCFINKIRKDIQFEILQAQIINKKLVCYMVISSAFPKELSLKAKINKYKASTRRNLQENAQEVILTTSEDSDGSSNKLIKFESKEDIISQNQENIQIKEITFNSDDETTSSISKNNNCKINLPSNTDFLDTGKVKSYIDENAIPYYSKIKQDSRNTNNIVYLYIDNIDGCSIKLKSENKNTYILNNNINIKFIESSSKLNGVSADCSTLEQKDGVIPCKINQNANNTYYINSEPINDNDKYIIISSSNKDISNYKIECLINNKKKMSKTLIIIIAACSLFVVIIIVVVIICIIKNKKGNNENQNKTGEKPVKNRNDSSKDIILK